MLMWALSLVAIVVIVLVLVLFMMKKKGGADTVPLDAEDEFVDGDPEEEVVPEE